MDEQTKRILDSIPKIPACEGQELARAKRLGMASFVSWCRKDFLRESSDGRLWSNWCDSFTMACTYPVTSIYLEKNAVITMKEWDKKCSNDKVVIYCEHH